ncbi:MAG: 2-oxo-4-hydroxy-4-carboxy-5-ureidoimidazoline decarboxylase, partial [Variibacter sp.]|nr:2-oxo-4-hydroxy-4-carboxy-5-ureidoimidazoline decarboxylase [Variibacter sp.]
MNRVSLDDLNAAAPQAFVAALGDIFEHSPWVAEAAAARRPFASLAALHAGMVAVVEEAGAERQLALLRAHPDLAGRAARAGALTADSTAEQASAGLDQLSEREFEAFQHLNTRYTEKFGFPFIICARRHTKSSILAQFKKRLENGATSERETAVQEVARIAALRLDQRVEAAERPNLNGRLSTHVLDTSAGRPAAGMWIALRELPDYDD